MADWLALVRETFTAWNQDKAPRLAAALAFYSIFSMAPLLVIVIAGAGLFFGEQAAEGQVFAALRGLVGVEAALSIQAILQNVRQTESGVLATVISLGTLLLGATGVFAELQDALNTIWAVPPRPKRGVAQIVRERFTSFLIVVGIAALLFASLVISAVLSALEAFWGERLAGFASAPLDVGISFGITTVLFALIYKVLPDVYIAWRDVWLGAAFTAALFIVGKSLIGLYLGTSSVSSTYGAAGSLAVLLLWIFYSAQIFFLGAEFTKIYSTRRGSRSQRERVQAPIQQSPPTPPAHISRKGSSWITRTVAGMLGFVVVLSRLQRR
jgi:membrane protein